jgi:hypothetical protein
MNIGTSSPSAIGRRSSPVKSKNYTVKTIFWMLEKASHQPLYRSLPDDSKNDILKRFFWILEQPILISHSQKGSFKIHCQWFCWILEQALH